MFEESYMEVFVEFENPNKLSLDVVRPEALKITFKQPVVSIDGLKLDRGTELVIIIPKQFKKEELEKLEEF